MGHPWVPGNQPENEQNPYIKGGLLDDPNFFKIFFSYGNYVSSLTQFVLPYNLKCSQLISSSDNKKILLTTRNVRLDSSRYATKYYFIVVLFLLSWNKLGFKNQNQLTLFPPVPVATQVWPTSNQFCYGKDTRKCKWIWIYDWIYSKCIL